MLGSTRRGATRHTARPSQPRGTKRPTARRPVPGDLGPDGTVADVVADAYGYVSPEALDCVRTALAGLVFPCLANREICPEYVIAE